MSENRAQIVNLALHLVELLLEILFQLMSEFLLFLKEYLFSKLGVICHAFLHHSILFISLQK